jgi:hypothetical protein
MSRTLDPEVEWLLARARLFGMPAQEIDRWRREFDPIVLDTCGCDASARATIVSSTISGVMLLIAGRVRRRRAVVRAIIIIGASAVLGKLVGQRDAETRAMRALSILRGRVLELATSNSSPSSVS